MLRRTMSNNLELVSIPFMQCPAKTYVTKDGRVIPGRGVFEHCTIVGEVARELVSRFPVGIRQRLFPPDVPLVAAAHDVGKVSPCFFEKIRTSCEPECKTLPALGNIDSQLEAQWGGHAGVSQLAAKAIGAPAYIPEILGQHHGYTPPVETYRAEDEVFGGPQWQEQRRLLIDALKGTLGMEWPTVESFALSRLFAGLTTVSDWIGSGEFFEEPEVPWRAKISTAVDSAGFTFPKVRRGLSFADVFGFPPNDVQQALMKNVTSPGVYVLEAPTGCGKTEAAFYAAYQLLGNEGAYGIYFALPTQLTSNKIYDRFQSFLTRILPSENKHAARLLHGNAWLVETMMGEDASPGGAWFSSAKRGLLAPFAVGTIDQALMAGMNVRHGFVRAFGLAGKVVILDEVHTYDAYTGTLLEALVRLLRSLHCTVIILSATLHGGKKSALLGCQTERKDYPLVVCSVAENVQYEVSISYPRTDRFEVTLSESLDVAKKEVLLRAERGEQVLWIENTVKEAQERFLDLAARASEVGVACGLLHSRYTTEHRFVNEERWVKLYGKTGWDSRKDSGRILIGTQVLEQSLDIDADFLVTRFAPSDMLLQRIGRLWRHDGTPRPLLARREVMLLVPSSEILNENVGRGFGPTASVYSPYVLQRSLEAWRDRSILVVPQDVRLIMEQTYCARDEGPEMARLLYELEEGTSRRPGTRALRQLAALTLAKGGTTLAEEKAQTRYSESETTNILVLRGLSFDPERKRSVLKLLDGTAVEIPRSRHLLQKRDWRQIAVLLQRQMVAVQDRVAPKPVAIDLLQKFGLHHCIYLGDSRRTEAYLRVALVREDTSLSAVHGGDAHEDFILRYSAQLGYQHLSKQEE